MPAIQVRVFRHDDLSDAFALSASAGWNQTLADWQRFWRLSSDGLFVAEAEGRAIGTCAAFRFGAVGWIAMMLVDDRWRRRGVGRTLMEKSLLYLEEQGVATVRLDATPMGRPLYEKLGFVAEYELSRFRGKIVKQTAPTLPSESAQSEGARIEQLSPERFEECCAFERRAAGLDRPELLRCLFDEHSDRWRIASRKDDIVGYIASRPGRLASYLGPCVAEDDEVGAALLTNAFDEYTGKDVLLDIPNGNRIGARMAVNAGMTVERRLLRMQRGSLGNENLAAIWGSSGPEKG